MPADAEPVGGGIGCQPTGLSHPGARSLPGEQVCAALPGLVQNRAEGALQAVDQAGKLLGIDEVEICTGLEIANRNLQLIELVQHIESVPNKRTKCKR